MNKKGVTALVAIIILLFMTVSAAGTAFYWLMLIQDQIAAEQQLHIKRLSPEAQLDVLASNFDGKNLTIYIQNLGEAAVPISASAGTPTTLWVLKTQDERILCSTDWSGTEGGPICEQGCDGKIRGRELRKIVLSNLGIGSLCDISKLPKGSLILYTIDFSGKAAVSSGFLK